MGGLRQVQLVERAPEKTTTVDKRSFQCCGLEVAALEDDLSKAATLKRIEWKREPGHFCGLLTVPFLQKPDNERSHVVRHIRCGRGELTERLQQRQSHIQISSGPLHSVERRINSHRRQLPLLQKGNKVLA